MISRLVESVVRATSVPVKDTRFIIILAAVLGLGGTCYLGIRRARQYGDLGEVICFELRDPYHPKGLSAEVAQASAR